MNNKLQSETQLAEQDDIFNLRDLIDQYLKAVNYYDKEDRFNTPLFVKDILSRASITKKEYDHLSKMLHKIIRITKK